MPDAPRIRLRAVSLVGRPRASLVVLVVTFLVATVAAFGLTTSQAAKDAAAEAEARADAISQHAGRVGIGAVAFDTTAARVAADTASANAAVSSARVIVTDAAGKATAESLSALVAAVDRLEAEIDDATVGRWFLPRVHEVEQLRDAVLRSVAAWQAAEDARRAAEAAKRAEEEAILAADDVFETGDRQLLRMDPPPLFDGLGAAPAPPTVPPSVVDEEPTHNSCADPGAWCTSPSDESPPPPHQ